MLMELEIQADNATQSTIAILQYRLSDTLDLSHLLKEIRWSLAHEEGLKTALQKLIVRLDEVADDLAAQIASLGAFVHASTKSTMQLSSMQGLPIRQNWAGSDLIPLFEAVTSFQERIIQSVRETREIGHVATFESLANVSRGIAISLWKLGRFRPMTEGASS